MGKRAVVRATIEVGGVPPYSITAYDDGTYDAQAVIADHVAPHWVERMGPVFVRGSGGLRSVTVTEDAVAWVRGLVERRGPRRRITITELEEGIE
jgi:hypothetical protein